MKTELSAADLVYIVSGVLDSSGFSGKKEEVEQENEITDQGKVSSWISNFWQAFNLMQEYYYCYSYFCNKYFFFHHIKYDFE